MPVTPHIASPRSQRIDCTACATCNGGAHHVRQAHGAHNDDTQQPLRECWRNGAQRREMVHLLGK
jgi:hypothetical protein